MTHSLLLDQVRRHAMAHADQDGVASTPIRGLTTICTTVPGELQYAISRPMVVLVLQGGKRVSLGKQTFDFGAGDSLVITADVREYGRFFGLPPAKDIKVALGRLQAS
ncbi:MAG TPA: AraC family transcriptional regulator [Stenotrophomonas sp.]|nr:AraC family transcriptional regulator [Stenotrophomonas sp.]